MDEKIDKIISLCGTKNKYQIIMLTISFLSQVIFMSVPLSLPYLEDTPFVTYIDPSDPTKNITENLSYELCKNNISYSIVEEIHYSILMDTNCYCNRFKVALFGGLVYFGAFLGSFFYDVAADNFGRKITFIFSSIFYAVFNSLCAFSNNYWLISSFLFIQSLFCCLPNYASLMITTEVSHVEYRGIFSTIIICGFPASALVFFPIYKFLDSWKITFLINSASSLLLLLVFCLISYESPRFFFSKGQINKGIAILRKISEFHGISKQFDLLIEKEEYQNIINELNITFGNKAISKEIENDEEEENNENIKKIENNDNRLFDGDLSDKDIDNLLENEYKKNNEENVEQINDHKEDNNNINLNISENINKKENENIEDSKEKESNDDKKERANDNLNEDNINENENKKENEIIENTNEKKSDDSNDQIHINENDNNLIENEIKEKESDDEKDKKEIDEVKNENKENEEEKQQVKTKNKEKTEKIQDLNQNNSENISSNLNNDKPKDEIIEIKKQENKISNSETHPNDHNNLNKNKNVNWTYLFIFPSIRYKFLILCFFGFTVNGTYTGISITTKNLPGNMFVNTMIISVCEITFGVIASLLINTKKLGRKGTLILLYSIAMTSFLIYIIFKKMSQIAFLIIFCISRFSCFGLLTVIYTYFLENYPTCIRALAFGINSSFDNFGGTVFPFIIENISENNLYILLATLNFLEILCMLYMPETYGKPLPETIEELDSDKLYLNIDNKHNNKKNNLIYIEDKLKEPIIPTSESNRSSNFIY